MNYSLIYDKLINKAKGREIIEHGEWHHILPRSMGGTDDASNLVKLTYREHFIAHMLLYKVHKNKQMAFALGRMSNSRAEKSISSRTYALAREIHSAAVSKWSTEFMAGKTVFKNINTGEHHILEAANVDRTVWKGVNYRKKMPRSINKHHTCFKDHLGTTYFLDPNDPIVKELGLKGVGNFRNATIAAAKRLKARPWYYKRQSEHSDTIVLLIPSLYDWFCNSYDESRPKATGVAKWMKYNNINIRTKMFGKCFDKFKSGWYPDEDFYEVYNEINSNRKNRN
ncbi:putative homing endonuclease [Acinetobacter phage Stupor]|uniref:Putative homing endonuclease n=1 Tax=Acinetobacter phage Abraxas TaxID=2736222 RepID=A0A6M9Z693_9CAUD|nr:putative homing endonuclease [Acinetobacter phage Stupor]QKN87953.1 putative homing endonuclease [Acinetobacter phage Abraxas]